MCFNKLFNVFLVMKNIYPSTLSGSISVDLAINHGKLLDGIFSVKETGIDSKIFHSWKMAGILSTVQSGKWAKLSFIEYLWLSTLETMRKFGCSKKLMMAVHYSLFTKAYEDNLAKHTLEDNIKFLTALSAKRPLTYDENGFLEHSITTLADPKLMSTMKYSITHFYQLVLSSFINNNEVGIVIYEDDTFSTYHSTSNIIMENNTLDLSVPHLLIPISSFIKKFVADEEKIDFLTTTGLLNDQEFEVVKQIRQKNIKRITITYNDSNHAIQKIEAEVTGIIKGDEAKRIMQTLGLKNYSGIEIHTRDGKTLSFTQTTKILMP